MKPIILIVRIKSLCVQIKNDLRNCSNLPCYESACNYWASRCYITDKSSIEDYIARNTISESDINAFTAYCLFLTTQATSRKDNETIKMLYDIALTAYSKISEKKASVWDELQKLNKQYEKVIDMLKDERIPRSQVADFAAESLNNSMQKRKMEEDEEDEEDEEEDEHAEYMEFVKTFQKERAEEGLRMNWKLCLTEGKKKLGWKYKNGESLRAQFSKYKKRKN